MKEFLIYTAMRIGLFIGTLGIVVGIWWLIAGEVPVFWAALVAFIISGVASFFILERQRQRFAVKVEGRAQKAAEKFEEKRAAEDTPEGPAADDR